MPQRQYGIPSDVDSASEIDDSSGVALGSVTKEKLYQSYLKMQRRGEKYKGKFTQVLSCKLLPHGLFSICVGYMLIVLPANLIF